VNPTNFDFEEMYKAVENFRSLGTGREHNKVLVGTTSDARTATFICVGNISRNWPSWNQIRIKTEHNRIKVFDLATKTVNGQPAYIFHWNELTTDLWYRQKVLWNLQRGIEALICTVPRDFIGMSELIVEETGSEYRLVKYPGLERANLIPILIEIRKLSVPSLRQLNSLIAMDSSSASSTAA
jgi:hypothetical protein